MPNVVTTTDLYESCYYLLNGCELASIEYSKVNGKITCQLSFQSENITSLQIEYFHGKAKVNLFDFRRAFGQVLSLVKTTKKKAKNKLNQPYASEQLEGGNL